MTEPLEAGRELDVLVAEKVMGLKSKIDEGYAVPTQVFSRAADLGIPGEWWGGAPYYSSDIAAAWTVVEYIAAYTDPRGTDSPWMRFYRALDGGGELLRHTGTGAAEAICRAALIAVGALTR